MRDIRDQCSCNTKLRISAPDNTTIAAGAMLPENLHVNCFCYLRRRKCYSDEKSRRWLVYHEQKWQINRWYRAREIQLSGYSFTRMCLKEIMRIS